jgi:hypothetical protein
VAYDAKFRANSTNIKTKIRYEIIFEKKRNYESGDHGFKFD